MRIPWYINKVDKAVFTRISERQSSNHTAGNSHIMLYCGSAVNGSNSDNLAIIIDEFLSPFHQKFELQSLLGFRSDFGRL